MAPITPQHQQERSAAPEAPNTSVPKFGLFESTAAVSAPTQSQPATATSSSPSVGTLFGNLQDSSTSRPTTMTPSFRQSTETSGFKFTAGGRRVVAAPIVGSSTASAEVGGQTTQPTITAPVPSGATAQPTTTAPDSSGIMGGGLFGGATLATTIASRTQLQQSGQQESQPRLTSTTNGHSQAIPSSLDLPDDLLNSIKDLRDADFQDDLEIPQLIVCGDQSAGKSSVLEAISRFGFPSKGTFCTRFVTEVNMRYSPIRRCRAEIRPAENRNEAQRDRLLAFKTNHVITGPVDLATAIEAAGQELSAMDRNISIYADQLVIYIEGPDQKPLTLVDLPGLIHHAAEGQATQDIDTVKHIVEEYMLKQESIILAIVAADNNLSNQGVVEMARAVKDGRSRTLGIITKPDKLDNGSPAQLEWLKVVRNTSNSLDLGWHVLKNRDYANRDVSFEKRDELEANFFRETRWRDCHDSMLGIDALRRKLGDIQTRAVGVRLPGLVDAVKDRISSCRARKRELGEPLETQEERSSFLDEKQRQIHVYISDGLRGWYADAFFDQSPGIGESVPLRRIRARIRDTLDNFAREMKIKGVSYEIIPDVSGESVVSGSGDDSDDGDYENESYMAETMHTSVERVNDEINTHGFPILVSQTACDEAIGQHVRRNRGCEPYGVCPPSLVSELFHMQAAPWKTIVQRYSDRLFQDVRRFFEEVVRAVTPAYVANNIIQLVAEPAWQRSSEKLDTKIQEILFPYLEGELFTLDADEIHEGVSGARALIYSLVNGNLDAAEANNRSIATQSWSIMTRHFNIARSTVLENFVNLAIERCLVGDLRTILLDQRIPFKDLELTKRIVDAPEDLKLRRDANNRKLETLERVLIVLRRHVQYRGRAHQS